MAKYGWGNERIFFSLYLVLIVLETEAEEKGRLECLFVEIRFVIC